MGILSLWSREAEQTADQIARTCIELRDDGGYWFHHAKAVAIIDRALKEAKQSIQQEPSDGQK